MKGSVGNFAEAQSGKMAVFLQALSLTNYGGIGPVTQRMYPFRGFNFFIGANNVGKSTVLNFLSKHLAGLMFDRHDARQRPALGELEKFSRGVKGHTTMEIGVPVSDFFTRSLALVSAGSARAAFDASFGKSPTAYPKMGSFG